MEIVLKRPPWFIPICDLFSVKMDDSIFVKEIESVRTIISPSLIQYISYVTYTYIHKHTHFGVLNFLEKYVVNNIAAMFDCLNQCISQFFYHAAKLTRQISDRDTDFTRLKY